MKAKIIRHYRPTKCLITDVKTIERNTSNQVYVTICNKNISLLHIITLLDDKTMLVI